MMHPFVVCVLVSFFILLIQLISTIISLYYAICNAFQNKKIDVPFIQLYSLRSQTKVGLPLHSHRSPTNSSRFFFRLQKIKNHAVPFILVSMVLRIEYILMFAHENAILLFLFLNRMDGVTLALGVACKA